MSLWVCVWERKRKKERENENENENEEGYKWRGFSISSSRIKKLQVKREALFPSDPPTPHDLNAARLQ